MRAALEPNQGGQDADARAPAVADEVQPAAQDPPYDAEEGSAEPVLRVPEELTPLPAVDAAMPLLGMFATVVGRKRARYKVGLLKTLQADGSGRWKIRRLQEIVHWLEPASVTEVVAELRAVDVLAYEPVTGLYRLTPAARVVTALLDAMTIPEVHPRALIKFLNKAMALAQAGGAGDDVVLRQFRSAIAVLRSDWEDLTRLIDDFSDTALLEAAELVRVHVDDMRDLLDEHQSFFASQHERALFLDADQEALDLIARLGKLAAEVIEALSGRASGRMRAGLRVDRVDIREFLLSQTDEQLAGLFADLALPAPFVIALSPTAAFEALAEASERVPSLPPPLPPASPPERRVPERLSDPAESMREELSELGASTTVAAMTVRATWGESVARHSALVDAYSRYTGLPRLDHQRDVEELTDSEVWRVSKTTIHAAT